MLKRQLRNMREIIQTEIVLVAKESCLSLCEMLVLLCLRSRFVVEVMIFTPRLQDSDGTRYAEAVGESL